MSTKLSVLLTLAGLLYPSLIFSQQEKTKELTQGDLFAPDSLVECLILEGYTSRRELNKVWKSTAGCANLQRIELIDCSVPNTNLDKNGQSNLKALVLTNCPRTNTDKLLRQISSFPALETLILDNCGIIKHPEIFAAFPSLLRLELDGTFIEASSGLTFLSDQTIKLQFLALKNLSLPCIDSSLLCLGSLQGLDISGNGMTELPDSIVALTSLTWLNLEGNEISRQEICKLKDLPLEQLSMDISKGPDSILIRQILPGVSIKFTLPERYTMQVSKSATQQNQPAGYSFADVKYKTIHPPAKEYVKGGNKYTVENSSLSQIISPAGSVVTIPARSIVDKNGIVVEGPLDIVFREFADPLEIVLSGIPMQYDSAGIQNDFQTAGMFEILAFKDGEPLFLAPGAKMTVDLASVSNEGGFSLYQYDDDEGSWNYEADPSSQIITTEIAVLSNAFWYYPSFYNIGIDTTSFENRYLDTAYARTISAGSLKYLTPGRMPLFKIRRCKVPGMRKEMFFQFPFTMMNRRGPINQFPELAYFSNCLWKYTGTKSRNAFIRSVLAGKKYTDVRITYNESKGDYTIELKSLRNYFITITATPYTVNELKDGEMDGSDGQLLFARYEKKLKSKEKSFNKKIAADFKKADNRRWKEIKRSMSPEEKKMSREEWIIYARKVYAQEEKKAWVNNSDLSYITRSFAVDGFGMWNCDRPVRYTDPVRIVASRFVQSNGEPLAVNLAYTVDNKSKAVVTNYVNSKKTMVVKSSREESGIILVGTNGKIYMVNKEQISQFGSDPRVDLACYYVNPKVTSYEDLKKRIGF